MPNSKPDLDSSISRPSQRHRAASLVRGGALLGGALSLAVVGHAWLVPAGDAQTAHRQDEIERRLQYQLRGAAAPSGVIEIDLGPFMTCVQRDDIGTALRLHFDLALAVRENESPRFEQFLATNQHRLRDRVIRVVNSTSTHDLTDPHLRELKTSIAAVANEMYGSPAVATAAFGKFSFEEQ